MKELLTNPAVLLLLKIAVISLSAVAIVLIIVLRDRISAISVSRTSLQIHTNDVLILGKSHRKAYQIDNATRKAIRKATTGLMILDPDTYGMTAEVLLVNSRANSPLVHAGYENNHTEELSSEGADVYFANKANDVLEVVRVLKKYFPNLTDEMAYNHTCLWIKKVLIPNVRKACYEKIKHYTSVLEKSNVARILKVELTRCIRKNELYIKCLDELAARPDISDKSSILSPPQVRGES